MFVLACKQWDLICVEGQSGATSNPKMQDNFIHYFVLGGGGVAVADECLLCSRKYTRLSRAQDLKIHHNKCI